MTLKRTFYLFSIVDTEIKPIDIDNNLELSLAILNEFKPSLKYFCLTDGKLTLKNGISREEFEERMSDLALINNSIIFYAFRLGGNIFILD